MIAKSIAAFTKDSARILDFPNKVIENSTPALYRMMQNGRFERQNGNTSVFLLFDRKLFRSRFELTLLWNILLWNETLTLTCQRQKNTMKARERPVQTTAWQTAEMSVTSNEWYMYACIIKAYHLSIVKALQIASPSATEQAYFSLSLFLCIYIVHLCASTDRKSVV